MNIKHLNKLKKWDRIFLTFPIRNLYQQESIVLNINEECFAYATFDDNRGEILEGFIYQDLLESDKIEVSKV